MSTPVMILSFLLAITILVAVHEFGHFWVARRVGVRVLRFSIGFGKPLLRWRRKGDPTEYIIAAIPLGGYVKMLDEREGEVSEADLPFAFNRKPLLARVAVVFAGPLFNFLFAIFAFWLMFMVGVSDVRPVIGKISPDSPAAVAGLQEGEEIVAVNGKPTPIWQVVMDSLAPSLLERQITEITVRR
ncbi:MAG TPA: RIP metalloprotease RseP, partial [Gammaproteobacteria bacterium]|nr:RIP metalloprotease RseP [Gammaproteobacteria bacterium]